MVFVVERYLPGRWPADLLPGLARSFAAQLKTEIEQGLADPAQPEVHAESDNPSMLGKLKRLLT